MTETKPPIKKLWTEKQKGDKIFTLYDESEHGYMYKVVDVKLPHVVYFEVFKKKTQRGYDHDNKKPADYYVEKYPSNSHFGEWAWNFRRKTTEEALKKAYEKFNNLKNL